MKGITKKILTMALTMGMSALMSISPAFASDVTVGDDSLENEYIKVYCSTSRYGLLTTGGEPDNPNDDNKNLLFPTTSRMFVSIDGNVRTVDAAKNNDGEYLIKDASQKQLRTSISYNDIQVEKIFKIVPNSITGREDTVEFKMVVTNNSAESHNVGARIMLDTMLGYNDDAPFRVPNIGAVTDRLQLSGNDIPEIYQAFDNLSKPTIVSTGSFATGSGKPDVVQFNNWDISTYNDLIPACNSDSSIGDSAVNSIWSEKTLASGKSIEYKTYYGLGQFIVNGESELVVGATKVTPNFVINEDHTGYNPVSIIGYVQNSGYSLLNNVRLSIGLPDGVTLVSGENDYNVGSLEVNSTGQTTCKINAEPSYVEREITITIGALSDEISNVTPVTFTYILPALERPSEPETEPATEITTEEITEAATDTATSPTQAATDTVASPTEAATQKPTQSATFAPTSSATDTSTDQASSTSSTASTTTGKVATGESSVTVLLIIAIILASGLAVFVTRKPAK